jgi:MarR family transcriptional regulator, negative regulator of the multidrug operon emrRAB
MSDVRTANLLGALVLALDDDISAATAQATDHGAAFPAALVCIHWQPGCTIEELRQKLRLSHSGTVRLLDRLEADGAIERQSGRDGRSVALGLSAQGRRRVRAILEARHGVLSEALAPLSPAERRELGPLLEKVLAGITRDVTHADQVCRLCDEASCPAERCPVECAVTR